MTTFAKLTRPALRSLKAGEAISEHGITFTRLANGDGRWSVNVMANRKRHHRIVGTESEGFTRTQAEEMVASIKASKRERAHGIRKSKAVTFREAGKLYLEHLEATGGKDVAKKRQRLTLHLYPHLGGLQLSALTQTDLRRYSAARAAEKASPATINRELAVVSHLLGLAADPDELALLASPPFRIQRMKEPESKPVYLRPREAQALIRAAMEDPNEHVLAFCMVGLHTGMRYESILRIRCDEVDTERRIIWVDKDKAGERQQPVTRELSEFLETYLEGVDGDWLFPSARSKSGRAANVYKAFRRVVAAAGLRGGVTPHKLRHTMATNAAHAGVDPATLQAMGGWKSRRMVEKYTHAGAMQDAMDKLETAYAAKPAKRARRRRVTQGLQRTGAKA